MSGRPTLPRQTSLSKWAQMDLSFVILIEMLYAIASLVLISAGLAVVFGMMKVINLAHGEFMMLGGYLTITAVGMGVNVFVAMLVIAPLIVGLIGLVVERLVIRHLYGRLVDTMLATWGLSLVFIGIATMIFGNTTTGISTPIPGFTVGNYQINGYNFFIIVVAIVLVIVFFVTSSDSGSLVIDVISAGGIGSKREGQRRGAEFEQFFHCSLPWFCRRHCFLSPIRPTK